MAPSVKPTLPPLKTSKSPTFPSELHDSPLFSSKTESIKQEDFLRTPITPPVAYSNFLKMVTPIVASPSSARDKNFDRLAVSMAHHAPASASASSATSSYFCSCRKSPTAAPAPAPASASATSSPVVLHHHFRSGDRVRKTPTSARPLRINTTSSPKTATASPSSECPRCYHSARSPFPSADWVTESTTRRTEAPTCTSCSRPISVRHVVTRTITYKCTALEPAPKGKRRKTDE